MKKDTEKTFILTDGCMWEMNKQSGKSAPHAIEVVDSETGAIRFIKSGSRIAFIEGEISLGRSQEIYNEQDHPLKSSNELLRSLMAIVKRKGKQTNWPAIEAALEVELKAQHEILYPDQHK